MKEIKLNARLSAYSKVDAISCHSCDIEDATTSDIDNMFEDDNKFTVLNIPVDKNAVTPSDIDAMFN